MLHLLARDAILYGVAGLGLGFVVDFFFVDPDPEESTLEVIFYILLQVIVCTIITYYIGKCYEKYFGGDKDQHTGFTLFIVIFFLVQVQLFERISLLFHRMTGKKLPNGM